MSTEGHYCGPLPCVECGEDHGCICGNDCDAPQPEGDVREALAQALYDTYGPPRRPARHHTAGPADAILASGHVVPAGEVERLRAERDRLAGIVERVRALADRLVFIYKDELLAAIEGDRGES